MTANGSIDPSQSIRYRVCQSPHGLSRGGDPSGFRRLSWVETAIAGGGEGTARLLPGRRRRRIGEPENHSSVVCFLRPAVGFFGPSRSEIRPSSGKGGPNRTTLTILPLARPRLYGDSPRCLGVGTKSPGLFSTPGTGSAKLESSGCVPAGAKSVPAYLPGWFLPARKEPPRDEWIASEKPAKGTTLPAAKLPQSRCLLHAASSAGTDGRLSDTASG